MTAGGLRRVARRLWPSRRSGRAALLGLVVVLPLLAVALHTGWGRAPEPWQQSTGWDRIDPALRPAAPRSRFVLGGQGASATGEPDGTGETIDLHWLGHSGFLLEWRGVRLLLDPNTSDHCTIAPRLMEPAVDVGALGPIDAVLVSHAHYDHLDLPTLAAVRDLRMIVVPAGSEEYVADLAPARGREGAEIIGLEEGISAAVGPLTVTAVHARHNGNRHHPLASRHLAVGYVIHAGGESVYFAGDTGDGSHLDAIGAELHPRLAILPIGAFSPPVPIGLYHLSPEQAVSAGRRLGAEVVVPCHFGTFVLALDRATTALPRFARAANAAGLAWAMPELLTEETWAPTVADRWRRP